MRVVHEPADGSDELELATDVDVADTEVAKMKGLMFRKTIPEDYAMVFEFDRTGYRFIHTLFVRRPLDVLWLDDDEVVKTATLHPWRGIGWASADRVIEFPAGAAGGVAGGDTVRVDDESD